MAQADLLIRRGSLVYVAEIKSITEGRAGRVIPLLAQAILQAQAYARDMQQEVRPLAIVEVGEAGQALLDKVAAFAERHAPGTATGVIAADGVRHFTGEGLASLNVAPARRGRRARPVLQKASNLFSDLNQWMLKVLLAPEIPESLLTAPRGEYETASSLAHAASVSVMSASRFVHRLREDGFLDDGATSLRLVRRGELFRRWRSAADGPSPQMRMCFLNPGAGQTQLYRAVSRNEACLGLFAAADALGIGHVAGAPADVYVRNLERPRLDLWPELVAARAGDAADLILRQAQTPEAVFRAAVPIHDVLVSDVLQVWLDAGAHPSRGQEQAEYLQQTVLADVLGDWNE